MLANLYFSLIKIKYFFDLIQLALLKEHSISIITFTKFSNNSNIFILQNTKITQKISNFLMP